MAWTVDALRERLTKIIDPEVGLNIVEMGLIYDLSVDEADNVHVRMTLTTPGCPMHGSMADGVQELLESLPGIGRVDVEVTFDPPWEPKMMSEEALRKLGWL
ncbi:MAG: iron-sulfur cluster assembly protein [Actinomycetia bacterium]|nr:iron-sulfur cluster assembly protein [Actinomycetes bacterium]